MYKTIILRNDDFSIYKLLSRPEIDTEYIDQKLNMWLSNGWELVSMVPLQYSDSWHWNELMVTFKRAVNRAENAT